MRPSLTVDTRSIPLDGEAVLRIPYMTLVRKLVTVHHVKAKHFLDVDLVKIACILEELASEKIDVDRMETSILPTVPGTGFYIQGWRAPNARCNIIEDLMVELHERGLAFITIGKVCAGINRASGASVIYKDILGGKI